MPVLLSFRVANHRSLRAERQLSFVVTDDDSEGARFTGLRSDGREVRVTPVLGICGANASGKSNVLAALRAMRDAVRNSVAEWGRRQGVPREPFALDPACQDETTLFEVDLLLGEGKPTRYTYGFELSDERVEAEWLHAYPDGRRQVWFDREHERDDGSPEFHFPDDNLKGSREQLVELTRPNALFLTVGANFNHQQLGEIFHWFLNNLWLVTSATDVARRSAHTRRLLVDPNRGAEYREKVERLIRAADLGITGLRVDPSLPEDQQVQLLHRTGSGQSVALSFASQESRGTHAWFAFLGPVLQVLEQGSVLLADELDASTHPLLAAEVVRLFHDPKANPNNAQLLFTTHDATLLGKAMVSRPLDREQVWITDKRPTGETELYPLADACMVAVAVCPG